MKINDQGYAVDSFKKNIIYPDFRYSEEYTETTSGTYVTGFYFDGILESKVKYDMGSFSTSLLSKIRKAGVYLVTVKFGKQNVKAVLFSYYSVFDKQMKGRIIALDDLLSIESIVDYLIEENKYPYTRTSGYSPDAWLKSKHPEAYAIISKNYNNN